MTGAPGPAPGTVCSMLEQASAPLAPLTTLRVGGPARRMVTATTEQEIVETVKDCDARGEPLLILAGGSNLLIGDDGFDGTVLKIATTGVTRQKTCSGLRLGVAAGHDWDAFAAEAVSLGAVGVEALSGIPGSAGATPIQNVGAYGQEVSQSIAWIRALDRQTGEIRGMQSRCLEFGYRDSIFKKNPGKYVVLTVWFGFDPPAATESERLSAPIRYAELARALGVAEGDRVPLAEVRDAVLKLRAAKGMVLDAADHDTWSAGSFFTNPVLDPDAFEALAARAAAVPPRFPAAGDRVKTSAAWLIEQAGYPKGYGKGPATLSTKHTLALTNRGSAAASDVLGLAREIRDGVRDRFGVELVPEPVLVSAAL
ncbi:MAG: UDP-N-acetylmuramate dehydrogenase [Catenulisporales bacterium]|jgi:UDP-N-acetylmuramate dehydrogenase|nr:UDP-N-acetylmuramate dehydrogenase [Catenulisporales bacterium]